MSASRHVMLPEKAILLQDIKDDSVCSKPFSNSLAYTVSLNKKSYPLGKDFSWFQEYSSLF